MTKLNAILVRTASLIGAAVWIARIVTSRKERGKLNAATDALDSVLRDAGAQTKRQQSRGQD
jgi:hypothetical protein